MPRFITSLLAITLVVPALVFFTDLTRNPYYFQIVLLNALAVALAVSYLARGLRQGSLTLRRTPADLPFLAFFAVASLSWLAMLAANTSLGEPDEGELRLAAARGDWSGVLRTASTALRSRLTAEG